MWEIFKAVFERKDLASQVYLRTDLRLILPKSLCSIIIALEATDSVKLTMEFVKGKLLDFEIERRYEYASNFKSQSNVREKNPRGGSKIYKEEALKCYNCGKLARLKKKCRFREQAHQIEKCITPKETEEHIAFVVVVVRIMSNKLNVLK